jgi:hypothetical protein
MKSIQQAIPGQGQTPGQVPAAPNWLIEAVVGAYQEPLIIATYGDPGSGKSRLAGTAPSIIGLVPTEHKAKQTILTTAAEFGRQVILPKIDLVRASTDAMVTAMLPSSCLNPEQDDFKGMDPKKVGPYIQELMQKISEGISITSERPTCCKRHCYRWHVNRAKYVILQMAAHPDIKSIVIDSFGTFVQDVQYANYGVSGKIDASEFGFAPREDMNAELRELMNAINHKHLILTHHSNTVWLNNKPTNKTKPLSAWSKLGHDITVMIEQTRDDDAILRNRVRQEEMKSWLLAGWTIKDMKAAKARGEAVADCDIEKVYKLSVKDCPANAGIIGMDLMVDEENTFQALAMAVYPDSQPEVWL